MTTPTTTLNVQFVSESAAFESTFGWYNRVTGYGGVLFADVEQQGHHAPLTPGVSSVNFTVNTADLGNIDFFLISDGYNLNRNDSDDFTGQVKVIKLSNGTWAVADVDAQGNVKTKNGKPDILKGEGVNALFTETSKNAGGVDYASSVVGSNQTAATLAGDRTDGATGLIAWEDIAATKKHNGTYTKPGDADYNDAVFQVSIVNANGAPVAINDTASATEAGGTDNGTPGADAVGNVLTNDTDPDAGDSKTVAAVAGLAANVGQAVGGNFGTLTLNANGTYIYVVNNANATVQELQGASNTLTDSFTYTMQDAAGATSTATLTVTIHGANDAPTVSAAVTGAGAEGFGTFSTDLLANASDVDHGAVLHVENVIWDEVPGNLPAGFSLVGNTISVDTDSPAYDGMAQGAIFATHFTYDVVDEHGARVTQHATVTITGTNDGPVANADVNSGVIVEQGVGPGNTPAAGTDSASGNVLANDTDVDLPDTQAVVGVQAGNAGGSVAGGVGAVITGVYGDLTLAADGSWTYTLRNDDGDTNALAAGEPAADVFTYTMQDSAGAASTATLTVNLTGTNDAPEITPPAPIAVAEDTAGVGGQFAAVDPDHNAQLTWNVVGGTTSHPADYQFQIDELKIIRFGNTLFDDTFDAGGPPPQAPQFVGNPNPNSYAVTGTFTESGGRAIMDSDLAGVGLGVGTPDPFILNSALVRTNINTDAASQNAGLRPNAPFVVEGTFDLSLPDDLREAYGIRLTDRLIGGTGANVPPDQQGDDGLDLVVRMGVDGIVRVQLVEVDFLNDQYNILGGAALNPGPAVDQIVLRLSHDPLNPGLITASFDLLDGGVVVGSQTLGAQGRIFGTETPAFLGDDENWTRAQIVAYAPEESGSSLNGTFGVLTVRQDGSYTYNPFNNHLNVQALALGETVYDEFQLQVTDEHGATDIETVRFNVTGVNDGPVVSAAVTGAGNEGFGTFSTNLLANASDVDHGAVLHVENVIWDEVPGNLPAGFSLVGNTISVDTDNPAYDAMAQGATFATHFTYDVVDEHGARVTQHATVTITGTNDGPVANADVNSGVVVEQGVGPGNTPAPGTDSASGNVLANDTDVDLPDTQAVVGVQAGNAGGSVAGGVGAVITGVYGDLTLAADGSWTYTLRNDDGDTDALAAGEPAADVFTYTMQDSAGAASTATLTVNLTGTNDAPVIVAGGGTTGSVQEDTANQATGDLDALDPDNGAVLTWTAQGGTSSANANFLFSADVLTIAKNGNPSFFVDNFDDGNPPPAVPAAFTSIAPNGYGGSGVNGTQEAGGRLIFDSDNAVLFDAPGAVDPVVGVNALLRTNIDPANLAAGLKADDNFTLSAVFDLILPDSPREAYGIHLTDRLVGGPGTPPDQAGDDVIELIVRQNLSGNVVVALREIDHVADVTTNIQSITLNAPAGADQIRLNLTHSTANVGAIVASFDYLDGGVVVGTQTFSQIGRIFGTETPGTGDDENWTRAEITAYAPAQSDSLISGTYGTLNVNQAGTWTYNLDNSRASTQALAQGQTETDVFTIEVMDEHGASDTETVTINVAGTNDGPIMQTAAVSRTTAEDSETPNLTETGLAIFTDFDLNDTHTTGASLQLATLSTGNPLSAGLSAALATAMTTSLFNPSTGDGHGEVQWDFALANSAAQVLAQGETLTAIYNVTVTDNNNAPATQTVTINITGANGIQGDDGANTLVGTIGVDNIQAGPDGDTLIGGLGSDALTGGAGADQFVFQATDEGSDTIIDFAGGLDSIGVFAGSFGGGLVAGQPLAANQFVSGSAPVATAANGQFIYNTDTGALSWDADGTDGGAAVQLATLTDAPLLTLNDFLLL